MDAFYIDVAPDPAAIPAPSSPRSQAQQVQQELTEPSSSSSLLLPSHVSVFGSLPVQNLPSPSPPPEGEESYIEFLDYGGNSNEKGLVRYFQTQEEEIPIAPTVIVCKRCGAKGEHKAANCPVIVECPTLWRMYDYLTESARNTTLEKRRARKNLPLGQGGEGFIAEDVWCYNCGGSGHWGDDCKAMPHNGDLPVEYSAFSSHNLFSGPFADFDADKESTSQRELRDWEQEDYWGDRLPTNVGKKGRKKEIANLRKATVEEDEADNWFERSTKSSQSGGRSGNGRPVPTQPAKMKVSIPRSLQDRLKDGPRQDEIRRDDGDRRGERDSRSKEKSRQRDSGRDRYTDRGQPHGLERRDSNRSRDDHRGGRDRRSSGGGSLLDRIDGGSGRTVNKPRYKGGYSR
ncbi:hypothetical protein V5O48_002475 [Marasmius crinis-equi]|uniref:CCHC-type domain-containing protein n=1 Tax=Marasmius crinis-equi TaxID=585013 RepID=A0ABR3FW44_9AGAR